MLQDIGMGEDISKKTSVAEVDKCDIELKGKKKTHSKEGDQQSKDNLQSGRKIWEKMFVNCASNKGSMSRM